MDEIDRCDLCEEPATYECENCHSLYCVECARKEEGKCTLCAPLLKKIEKAEKQSVVPVTS